MYLNNRVLTASTLNTQISTETAVYETGSTGTYTNNYTSEKTLANQHATKTTDEVIHHDKYSSEDEISTKKTKVFEYSTTEIVTGITDEGLSGPKMESTTLGKSGSGHLFLVNSPYFKGKQ